MAIQLTINGETYQFPSNGDSPSWGESITDWAQAITNAVNSAVGNGDIIQTVVTINNNQTSSTNVGGLVFDTSTVRGAIVDYSIYRTTSSVELVEVGTMYLSYKSVANTWELCQVGMSTTAGVTFTVSPSGQVLYTSDNQSGTSYTGTMSFRARALLQ